MAVLQWGIAAVGVAGLTRGWLPAVVGVAGLTRGVAPRIGGSSWPYQGGGSLASLRLRMRSYCQENVWLRGRLQVGAFC